MIRIRTTEKKMNLQKESLEVKVKVRNRTFDKVHTNSLIKRATAEIVKRKGKSNSKNVAKIAWPECFMPLVSQKIYIF